MADKKDWTIMIYMAGDNNLSADMAYALTDIREAMRGKKEKINLMVFYDGGADNAPTIYCDFSDFDNPVFCPARLVDDVFKYKDQARDNPLNPNKNSAAVYSLMNFINWCVNETTVNVFDEDGTHHTQIHSGKPAEKYALIFSGHSSAFQNMSLMIDASSNYYMSISRLGWGLEQIASPTGHENKPLLKQKIDLLGFDSCVMGMAELAFEFRKSAKTMVASEGNLPSAGWTYGSILSKLCTSYSGSLEEAEKTVAASFVEQFIEKQSEFLIGGVSVDIAALDLDEKKIETVIEKTNNLAINLGKLLEDKDSEAGQRVKNALLLTHLECQSYMFEQNVDLKDFCEVLQKHFRADKETESLVGDCQAIVGAIDECILMAGFGGGTYQYSNGLAVFFPWTESSYLKARRNYEKLKAFDTNGSAPGGLEGPLKDWNLFLQKFTKLTRRPARVDASRVPGLAAGFSGSGAQAFFPTKNNGVANDKNAFMASLRNNGVANDKNNGVANDKNNGTANDKFNFSATDKNNGVANDKNNGVANDKGLMQLLMGQFKNTDSPWNISGFTKIAAVHKVKAEASES
jgi:hypothetical protein